MEEKAGIPLFLFPGSVGVTGGITAGVTDGFTINTKESEILQRTLLKQLTIYFLKH